MTMYTPLGPACSRQCLRSGTASMCAQAPIRHPTDLHDDLLRQHASQRPRGLQEPI